MELQGWISGRTAEGYLPGISNGEMFVAVEGSRLLGFGHAVPRVIRAIYLAPEAIGQGVGSALLSEAIARATEDGCGNVRLQSTLNAEGFYRHFGFHAIKRGSVKKGQISPPVIVMELPGRRGPEAV